MPGRAIIGSFIESMRLGNTQPKNCSFHCIKSCDSEKTPYCIMKALYNAYNGNMKKGYAFAGVNAFKAKAITTVKSTIKSLMDEFNENTKKD